MEYRDQAEHAARDKDGLAIGELASRTGVQAATLRMWERRYGFPAAGRASSGHRRFTHDDAEQVLAVLRARATGLSLPAAIERVRQPTSPTSLYAGLRRRRPNLQSVIVRKAVLTSLTHAIEDESCAQAEQPVLFGSFQREAFYRQAEARWRELARTAQLAVAFADFPRLRRPRRAPVEAPVDRTEPLAREWALVCHAPGHVVCLAGWELPDGNARNDGNRRFELLWSVEPDVAREAANIGAELLASAAPALAARAHAILAESPSPSSADQLRLATAITARLLSNLD